MEVFILIEDECDCTMKMKHYCLIPEKFLIKADFTIILFGINPPIIG